MGKVCEIFNYAFGGSTEMKFFLGVGAFWRSICEKLPEGALDHNCKEMCREEEFPYNIEDLCNHKTI